MRAYRIIGAIGRTLIAAGVLILLFVAYQLWGTGLHEARAQDDLRKAFFATTTTTEAEAESGAPSGSSTSTTSTTAPPPVPAGEAVAIIRIPRIGVDKAVVAGVSVADLKKGPGHYPNTPMPGQPGNAAIAGHRTTYGAPFYSLDELEVGDEILVTTRQGEFRFEVDRTSIVRPSAFEVLDPTEEARLTLTTCHPRFSARQRLVVSAVLAGPEAAPTPTTSTTAPPASETDDERDPESTIAAPSDPFGSDPAGLSGESVGKGPAITWGALAALVWFLTWFVGRRWKRWPAYLIGTPIFLVVLFVFFENFSRLLPANI